MPPFVTPSVPQSPPLLKICSSDEIQDKDCEAESSLFSSHLTRFSSSWRARLLAYMCCINDCSSTVFPTPNAMFLLGSLLYLPTATHDFVVEEDAARMEQQQESLDNDGDDVLTMENGAISWYYLFLLLATTAYLATGLLETRAAVVEYLEKSTSSPPNKPNVIEQQLRYEIGNGILFAFAASLELACSVVTTLSSAAEGGGFSLGLLAGSAHIYVINAICTLVLRKQSRRQQDEEEEQQKEQQLGDIAAPFYMQGYDTDDDSLKSTAAPAILLVSAGDWLFFVGACFDATATWLEYFNLFQDQSAALCLLSALAWFLDAVLYLLSDTYGNSACRIPLDEEGIWRCAAAAPDLLEEGSFEIVPYSPYVPPKSLKTMRNFERSMIL